MSKDGFGEQMLGTWIFSQRSKGRLMAGFGRVLFLQSDLSCLLFILATLEMCTDRIQSLSSPLAGFEFLHQFFELFSVAEENS